MSLDCVGVIVVKEAGNKVKVTEVAGSSTVVTEKGNSVTVTGVISGGGGIGSGTVTSVDLTAGAGITVSGGPITTIGSILVINSDRGSSQNIFKNIAVSGQPTIIADINDDTLTIVAGTGVAIITDATTDTLTISATGSGGTVTSIATSAPITGGTITTTGTIGITQAGVATDGFLSSTDWNTFNNKQGTITLTTTGSTGAATLISNTLNIPNYADQFVGTVTSVAALTLGTTGTDLSSSVVNSTTTPVITLNVPTASATNRGALSSADWTTFNSKEPALTKGNLTEATSAVLTITGGTGAVIGTGTTIQVAQAGASASGFLSSTDWNTFNGKQSALTFSAPLVNTSGTVSIPAATGLVDGFLSATDFVTFNGKQDALTLTTTGTTGAATLIGATLNIPNYADQFVGTVTSVGLTASTGISVSGSPITTSGSITVTNTAPDLTVVLTASTGITTSGTYPNFTIANSAPDQTVALTAGTGITTSGTYPSFTVTNSAPDQTVALTAGTGISVSGTYPNFTVTNSSPSSGGTVTSVAALTLGTTGTDLSSTVANGTTTPVITLQVPTASATNRGALSSTDFSTFNSKQAAITLTTTGSTGAATFISNTLNIPSYTDQFVGTVTSVNLTAGTRIEVAGGPVTTSGSITVTHGVAAGADFITAQTFEARVLADGGIFEALGEVAIAIGSLEDAASPSSTDFNDGVVIQNVAIDEFGHLLGVGATDLDERYVQNLTAGTGITVSGSPSSTAGLITVTNSDRGSSQNIFKNIAVSGQTTIAADTNDDTLTVVGGTGISVTTNDSTDTLTITNTAATSIACFAAYSTQNLSLTDPETSYNIEFDEQSVIDSSFYTHSTTVDPEEITVLSAGKYEISMGYVASNGSTAIAIVNASVLINGFYTGGAYSLLQLGASATGSSVTTGFNTYIYNLAANDVITSIFLPLYANGATGVITINPAGTFIGDGSTYITIKKLS